MQLTEEHINFLAKLQEMSAADGDAAWPVTVVRQNLNLPSDRSEQISQDLLDANLIAVHPRTKDCVVITEEGKGKLR